MAPATQGTSFEESCRWELIENTPGQGNEKRPKGFKGIWADQTVDTSSTHFKFSLTKCFLCIPLGSVIWDLGFSTLALLTFGMGEFFALGAVLCIVVNLVAHWYPKISPDSARCLLGAKLHSPLLRTTGQMICLPLAREWTFDPSWNNQTSLPGISLLLSDARAHTWLGLINQECYVLNGLGLLFSPLSFPLILSCPISFNKFLLYLS